MGAPRRALAWLLRSSELARALHGDRLLAFCTLGLALAGIAPLFVCRFLPFADLPDNIGVASLFVDAALGRGAAGKYFIANFTLMPYWSAYVIMAVAAALFGPLAAAKVIVGLLVVLLPLVTMRLLIALRRDPRLGLWAFALSWEHNLYFGWVTYLLGMSLALLATAWLLELEKPKDTIKIFVLSFVVGVTHIEAVAFLGVVVVLLLLTTRPYRRFVPLICVGASGTLLAIVPWLARNIRFGAGGRSIAFSFDWHTPSYKLSKMAEYTLDNIPTPEGQWVTASAFLVTLLGPAFLGGLRQHASVLPLPSRAWVVVAAAGALYFALPMAIDGPIGHWYTYPRYAPFMLLGLLFVVRPALSGAAAWALVPGAAVALAGNIATTLQLRSFDRDAAPLQQIIDAVKPNSTVLPLTFNQWHPLFTGFYPLGQMHAYIAATKRGFDPLLFDNPSNPLIFNPATRLPFTTWDRPHDYSFERHGQYYDYILVQQAKRDPVTVGPTAYGKTVRLVTKAGVWTLYAVEPTASP